MISKASNWGKDKMNESPRGAQRTSAGEFVWVRPLTLRQQLYAFFAAREEGSQLVEMALMFPLMLVLLTGMASFGMALYSQQQLGLAAANAVQGLATGATLNSGNPCQTVETSVANALTGWSTSSLGYTLTVYYTVTNTNGSTTTTSTSETWSGTGYSSCSGSTLATELGSTESQFQPAILTVTYPYTWFPIMGWANWGSTFKPSGTLQTTQTAMIQ